MPSSYPPTTMARLLVLFTYDVLAAAGYAIVHEDPQNHAGSQDAATRLIIRLAIAGPICALAILLVWYFLREPFRRIWRNANNATPVGDEHPLDDTSTAPHHGAVAGGLVVGAPPVSAPPPVITHARIWSTT
ncbi:hypothetical protein P691DRAFT_802074 [Macrolepiota fuliginosa MF-IS2]|uniref:Uncharacterized protein n=1 Tax=Macrolepiota fuliginosa MF-IS2 TaxID=1400762 RepID=A0A9P6C9K0_9AGAR|nr:hypothetical protein P691DRAFT_802074 [Macrolepiota fuliginosa MF-IS2]